MMSSASSQFEELSCGASEDSFSLLMDSNSAEHVVREALLPCSATSQVVPPAPAEVLPEGNNALLYVATGCDDAVLAQTNIINSEARATEKKEKGVAGDETHKDKAEAAPSHVLRGDVDAASPAASATPQPAGDDAFLNLNLLASHSSDSESYPHEAEEKEECAVAQNSALAAREEARLATAASRTADAVIPSTSTSKAVVYKAAARVDVPDITPSTILSCGILVLLIANIVVYDMLCYHGILALLLLVNQQMRRFSSSSQSYGPGKTASAAGPHNVSHGSTRALAVLCWLLVPHGLLCVLYYRSVTKPNSVLGWLATALSEVIAFHLSARLFARMIVTALRL